MISVDTHALLRRLLDDVPEQSRKTAKLFEASGPVLLTDVVLAETIWTLTGKKYHATKSDIALAFVSLLEEPNVIFESREAVWSALCDFNSPKENIGLAEALILNKAKVTAAVQGVAFKGHYTFDANTQTLTGTKKP